VILVQQPAPLLTVQDLGRVGHLADGVTRSGALDLVALAVANALVGNDLGAAALEGCLGGARFRFENDATFALTGAEVVAACNGHPVEPYVAATARAGETIVIERTIRGAIWYLAVRGGLDVPVVLGSRATLLSAGLGGVNGLPLRAGTVLGLRADALREAHVRPATPSLRTDLDPSTVISVTNAPRGDALSETEWREFYATTFTISRASSRVGYRLEGPTVPSRLAADLASEPACAGAVQLPPEGQPIVLMADHPTIGGYPMIGVVPACALGTLAQRPPDSSVRFSPLTPEEAIAGWNRIWAEVDSFASYY
jgi:biotin-dependent carboxylase-like uncharacterized protein